MGIVNSNEWLVVSLPRRKELTKFPNGGTQNCWSSLFPSRFFFFLRLLLVPSLRIPVTTEGESSLNGSSIIQRTNQSTFFFFFYNRRDDLTVAVCHFLSLFSFFFFSSVASADDDVFHPVWNVPDIRLDPGVYTIERTVSSPLATPLSLVAGWVFSHPERIEKKRKMQ